MSQQTDECPFCRKHFTYAEFTYVHQKLNGACASDFVVAPSAARTEQHPPAADLQADDGYFGILLDQASKPLAAFAVAAPATRRDCQRAPARRSFARCKFKPIGSAGSPQLHQGGRPLQPLHVQRHAAAR